ncbi:MAG: sigma-70 family RNA polymerase sigma factor [Chlorobi bacterium]|nr:sigma-70 family RNA polymerase sigma factor [Chlorobiota bacterium]
MDSKTKQKEFMLLYEVIHTSFIKYCKAKSYGIMDYKDLVNESVLRAFEKFERLQKKDSFAAYIYSIASNIIKNELRRKKISRLPDNYIIDVKQLTENHAIQKFEIEILYKALHKLPEKQKEAIILFEISGYSIKEIAEIQKSGISAIKQRLKRGRQKLSELLYVPVVMKEEKRQPLKVLLMLFF